MKQKNHHTTANCTRMRYIPPHTWMTESLLHEALLTTSGNLKTTIKDGPAPEDGRSNEWDGFDENDPGNTSSLWE